MKKLYILLVVICIILVGCGRKESKYLKDNFVFVEGGSVKLNELYKQCYQNKNPNVKLTYNLYVGKYEITQSDWKEIMGKEFWIKCERKDEEELLNKYVKRDKNYPVVWITWYDAIEFCNKLSKKENLPIAYDNKGNMLDCNGKKTEDITKVKGYRLLTRAEWEYAARGGIKSKGYRYSGGNNLNEVSWNSENSKDDVIHNVGLKKPNELGIYDMTGNVAEMCTDYLWSYIKNINPVGLKYSEKINCFPGNAGVTSRITKGNGEFDEKYEIGTNSWIEDKNRKEEQEENSYDMGIRNGFTGFRVGKIAD